MFGNPKTRISRGAAVSLSLLALTVLSAQTPIRLDPLPVGQQPLGVDLRLVSNSQAYVGVANSGDNSVSILSLNFTSGSPRTLVSLGTVTGIPSPYAVFLCSPTQMLVTSPSDGTVRVLSVPAGAIAGPLKVGARPYSASCFYTTGPTTNKPMGVVSNLGDNTLVIFDLATLAITATIPGVPGSRGFHGIAISQPSASTAVAWVAGTDANVVTVVDLLSSKILTQLPASQPTTVLSSGNGSNGTMSVASAGSSTVTVYSRDTLQVGETIQDVPNPQDFVGATGLGSFATMGGQNSLWRQDTSTSNGAVSTISVPGAAALAGANVTAEGLPSGGAVLVTSTSSNSVFLIQAQGPQPSQFSVANGASFFTQVAPGSLASAFAPTGTSQNYSATSLPLPTALGNVSLSVGGTIQESASGFTYSSAGASSAPLLFVGPNQVNFQVPPGIAPGSAVAAQLTTNNGTILLSTLNVAAASPGIFTILENGQGQGAVLNQTSSPNGNPATTVGATPASRGSVIQIFATGAGATSPALAAGQPAPASGSLVLTVAQPTVTIGGLNAPVQFSGMAPGFVGLWQINAVVPQNVTPGSAVSLVVSAGGVSSNTVTIAVQ
jgi:uncharacterized protein (TIGR03437 family)